MSLREEQKEEIKKYIFEENGKYRLFFWAGTAIVSKKGNKKEAVSEIIDEFKDYKGEVVVFCDKNLKNPKHKIGGEWTTKGDNYHYSCKKCGEKIKK